MPRFSIVMPVYNAEVSLPSTLDMLFSQTFTDIEVVVVNDASTDKSRTILDNYAARERRLKVVHHDINTYTGQARKDGVMASTGDYIMFVDQDDALSPEACERLSSIIAEHPVDIVHYGTKGVIAGDIVSGYQDTLDAFLRPYDGFLANEAIINGCFLDRSYSWNIWNKLFRAEICKAAHGELDMTQVRYGEDFYAYYVLAFFSKSYIGIPDEYLYTYYYGSGQTGRSRVDMKLFEFTCTAAIVVDKIEAFLRLHISSARVDEQVGRVRSLLIWEPACMFKSNVFPCDKPDALQLFLKKWGSANGLEALRNLYENDGANLAYELYEGGGILDLCQNPRPLEGELLSLSNDNASMVMWRILEQKNDGLPCFVLPQFNLLDVVRGLDRDSLPFVPVLCLCDAIAVYSVEEATCWRALGAKAVAVLPDRDSSEESVYQRCLSASLGALEKRHDDSSHQRAIGYQFVRECMLQNVRAHERIVQLEKQVKQASEKADLMRTTKVDALDRLEAVMRSSTWKVGSFFTWLPRKIKDALRSF